MFLLLSLITDLFIGAFLVKGVIRQDPLYLKQRTYWLEKLGNFVTINRNIVEKGSAHGCLLYRNEFQKYEKMFYM